jgi:hypothetical protein
MLQHNDNIKVTDILQSRVLGTAKTRRRRRGRQHNGTSSVQVKVETVRVHDNGTGKSREILSVPLLRPTGR